LRHFLNSLLRDNTGATAIEYGLILALVFLAMVGAVAALSTSTTTMWDDVSTKVRGS